MAAESIGEQIELRFLDALLALTARAVQVFVQFACAALLHRERGDDKARIGFVARLLGFATTRRPRLQLLRVRLHELFEAPRRALHIRDSSAAACSSAPIERT